VRYECITIACIKRREKKERVKPIRQDYAKEKSYNEELVIDDMQDDF